MAVGNLGPEVASVIRQIAVDAMETEQYMDFFRNRAFRQTLLCHSNVSLSRSVRAESVLDAFISTRLAPKSPEKIVNLSDPMEFVTQDGWPITSNAPLLTAALIALHEARPHRIGFQDLFELGASRLTSDCVQNFERQEYDRRRLGGELLRIYILGLIDIAHWAPNGLRGTQSYPKASTLVRHRARVSSTLTNMYHENLQVQDLERQILGHSDGKTSLEDVIRLLAEECLAGKLVIREGGKLVTEIGEAMKALSNLVPSSLDRLRRQGFLPGAAGLFCRLMFCLTLSSTKKAPGTD